MRDHLIFAAVAATAALAGCATTTGGAISAPAALINGDGQAIGTVAVGRDGDTLKLRVVARGLSRGAHGVHLHAVGRCDGPKFDSAGGHWNPTMKQHGHQNPAGFHVGDLGNLDVAENGTVSVELRGPSAAGVDDADGTALVIHAGTDDERTDPSGNSGGRMACAVISPPR